MRFLVLIFLFITNSAHGDINRSYLLNVQEFNYHNESGVENRNIMSVTEKTENKKPTDDFEKENSIKNECLFKYDDRRNRLGYIKLTQDEIYKLFKNNTIVADKLKLLIYDFKPEKTTHNGYQTNEFNFDLEVSDKNESGIIGYNILKKSTKVFLAKKGVLHNGKDISHFFCIGQPKDPTCTEFFILFNDICENRNDDYIIISKHENPLANSFMKIYPGDFFNIKESNDEKFNELNKKNSIINNPELAKSMGIELIKNGDSLKNKENPELTDMIALELIRGSSLASPGTPSSELSSKKRKQCKAIKEECGNGCEGLSTLFVNIFVDSPKTLCQSKCEDDYRKCTSSVQGIQQYDNNGSVEESPQKGKSEILKNNSNGLSKEEREIEDEELHHRLSKKISNDIVYDIIVSSDVIELVQGNAYHCTVQELQAVFERIHILGKKQRRVSAQMKESLPTKFYTTILPNIRSTPDIFNTTDDMKKDLFFIINTVEGAKARYDKLKKGE